MKGRHPVSVETASRPIRRAAAARALIVLVASVLGLWLLAGATAAPAGAQGGSGVSSYDIELTLEPSGALRVHEDVVYTLGPAEEHGFRRFVPLRVRYDDRHDRLYRIDDVTVSAEPVDGQVRSGPTGGVDDLATAESNDQFVIRIGSADTFIDGTWRYTLDYTVHDAVETVDVKDVGTVQELAWNVVGTQWTIPLGTVQVAVDVPAEPINTACYTGAFRSVQRCALSGADGRFELTVDGVSPGEAITVYFDFPPGTVADATAHLEERWSLARAFEPTPLTLGGSALASVAIVAGLGTMLARQGRDRRLVLNAYLPADAEPERQGLAGFFDKPDGPVQFRPPEHMTPGLCGVLVDEKADPLDVSATIVDLAVRGFLRIEEQQAGGGVFGHSTDFNIRFLKEADGTLNDYERLLLAHLRAAAGGADAVLVSELKTRFAPQLSEVRKAMYDETMRRKWFRRRPDHVRGLWFGLGVLALLVGIVAAVPIIAFTNLGLLTIPLVLPGLLLLFTASKMPSRTAEGRRQLELCVGYERFLEVADAEQLQYTEQQHAYVAGLPYAMVFGITEHWAQVLSVLQQQGVDLMPMWYVPVYAGGPFLYADFGRSMSSFSSVAAAALSAPQPSSTGGGFSGGGFSGGFSGGGGGGGGGGGW
jgi:uncharacterized membrane protein YgcG